MGVFGNVVFGNQGDWENIEGRLYLHTITLKIFKLNQIKFESLINLILDTLYIVS